MFETRGVRNREEIRTCIEMLADTPFWVSRYAELPKDTIVDEWEKLLRSGVGHLIVFILDEGDEDNAANSLATKRKYQHKFYSCIFACFITCDFAKEIIVSNGKTIREDGTVHEEFPDVSMHLFESLIAHATTPELPSLLISRKQLELAHKREPGCGLYELVFFVFNPAVGAIDLSNINFLLRSASYVKDSGNNMNLMGGGLPFHAMIINVYSEMVKMGITGFGATLFHEYSKNETEKSACKKRFLFCRTKNAEVSKSLNIPDIIEAEMQEHRIGNNYQRIFEGADQPRKACLNARQQKICYLTALGFSHKEIGAYLSPKLHPSSNKGLHMTREEKEKLLDRVRVQVSQDQSEASDHLYSVGYKKVRRNIGTYRYPKELLQRVIEQNLHEIRGVLFPLYPWPDAEADLLK